MWPPGTIANWKRVCRLVLDELKAHPVPEIPIPAYPNYHMNDRLGSQ